MEQLIREAPATKRARNVRLMRRAARIAIRAWRTGSMLDRLIDILGWMQV